MNQTTLQPVQWKDEDFDMIMVNGTPEGLPVWFDAPWLTKFNLDDFRLPTKNICRYYGAIDWRLVRHLALGSMLADLYYDEHQFIKLIKAYFCAHDLHEAVVGDMVAGQKRHHPTYREQESLWEHHVHAEIGLPLKDNPDRNITRTLDLRCLAVEMVMLEHPAANIITARSGGEVTDKEKRIFRNVQSMTLEECWKYVRTTIEEVANG